MILSWMNNFCVRSRFRISLNHNINQSDICIYLYHKLFKSAVPTTLISIKYSPRRHMWHCFLSGALFINMELHWYRHGYVIICPVMCGRHYLSISKLQRFGNRSVIPYWAWNYISMSGVKLMRVSKRGPLVCCGSKWGPIRPKELFLFLKRSH